MINGGMAITNQTVMVRAILPHHLTGLRVGWLSRRVALSGPCDRVR